MKFYLYVLFTALSLLVLACGSEEGKIGSNKGKIHPKDEFIDYVEEEEVHIVDKNNKSKSLIDKLNDGSLHKEDTGIFLSHPDHVVVKRDIHKNILILDKKSNMLYRYNVKDSTYNAVADKKPGPKSIAAASGMDVNGENVYISTRKMKLVHFKCDQKRCNFKDTNRLNFMPRDISISSNYIYTNGFAFTSEIDRKKFDSTIQKIKKDGSILKSFGKPYSSINPLVVYKLNKGHVEYTEEGILLYSLKDTPHIRVFEGGILSYSYKIDDFDIPVYKEGSSPPSLTINQAMKSSKVIDMNTIGRNKLAVSIYNKSWNREFSKKRPREIRSQSIDYYIINLSEKEPEYLGSIEGSPAIKEYVFFNNGKPIIYKDGSILLTRRSNAQ